MRKTYWLLLIALGLALLLRLDDVGHKIFGGDETTTALRISGFSNADMHRLADARPHSFRYLERYQSPNSARTWRNTIQALAVSEPQHPPLYYLVLRSWVKVFGSSVAAMRIPSAIIGALCVMATFWFCMELFGSTLPSLLAAFLAAVSPFYVAYSRQAREYSLFTLTLILASAALIRAVRTNSPLWFFAYAILVAVGLYCQLFFLCIVVAHVFYVLREAPKVAQSRAIYALLLSLILYVPWLASAFAHWGNISNDMAWAGGYYPLKFLFIRWLFNLGAVFFDAEFRYPGTAVALVPIFALIIYAFVALRHATKASRTLIVSLAIVPIVLVAVKDATAGTILSAQARYLAPTWTAVALTVAHLFSRSIVHPVGLRSVKIWYAGFLALFVGGLLSNLSSVHQRSWWDSDQQANAPEISQVVSRSAHPLLIAQQNFAGVFTLLHYMKNNVTILILPPNLTPEMLPGFSNYYALSPSEALLASFAKNNRIRASQVDVAPPETSLARYHVALRSASAQNHRRYNTRYTDTLWSLQP